MTRRRAPPREATIAAGLTRRSSPRDPAPPEIAEATKLYGRAMPSTSRSSERARGSTCVAEILGRGASCSPALPARPREPRARPSPPAPDPRGDDGKRGSPISSAAPRPAADGRGGSRFPTHSAARVEVMAFPASGISSFLGNFLDGDASPTGRAHEVVRLRRSRTPARGLRRPARGRRGRRQARSSPRSSARRRSTAPSTASTTSRPDRTAASATSSRRRSPAPTGVSGSAADHTLDPANVGSRRLGDLGGVRRLRRRRAWLPAPAAPGAGHGGRRRRAGGTEVEAANGELKAINEELNAFSDSVSTTSGPRSARSTVLPDRRRRGRRRARRDERRYLGLVREKDADDGQS